MFIGDKPPVFDGIMVLNGEFSFMQHLGQDPQVSLKMAYVRDSTKTTYGYCDFATLSPKTLEAFREFVRSAEEDFGQLIFEGGVVTPFGVSATTSKAESGQGLPKGLGE